MRLRWTEMEPEFSRQVWATRQETDAVATDTRLGPIWSLFALLGAVLLVTVYAFLILRMGTGLTRAAVMLFPAVLLAIVLVPYLGERKGGPHGRIVAGDLEAALQRLELSAAQRLYGETLRLALDAALPQVQGRELVRQLRALLTDDQRLAALQRRLQESDGPDQLRMAEQDQEVLEARLQREEDPQARHALAESVALCAERVAHLRALPPLQARVEAHRELLRQALLLAHATLLRARASSLTAIAPDLAGLRATVDALSSRARAIDEAASVLDRRLP
jgi:hypothetical protein